MIAVLIFIQMALQIAETLPKYKLGCDGSRGFCDCIGLIIGALKRAGKAWGGIHGSNYAARYRIRGGVKKISSQGDLKVGHLVFKGTPNGPKLPNRYKKGKSMYNGDLTDYYHVGIVISVSPLCIMHMTSPTIKKDTSLGKWGYYGECTLIDYGSTEKSAETITPVVTTEKTATVTAASGKTVNLRVGPSTKRKLVERIPLGETVTILREEGDWDYVQYGRYTGYMMDMYLMTGKEAA